MAVNEYKFSVFVFSTKRDSERFNDKVLNARKGKQSKFGNVFPQAQNDDLDDNEWINTKFLKFKKQQSQYSDYIWNQNACSLTFAI